jgi:Carboxypeptidase regulatory-like domain
MTSHLRPIIWTLILTMMPSGIAAAQKGSAQLAGTVVDHTSGAAVTNADIVQLGVGRKVVSDSLGKYLLTDLPAGIVRLMVRGGGFPTKFVVVALASGESMERVIELDSTVAGRATAQRLPVEAVVAPRRPAPRYADFERRRQTGRGQYLGRDELEKGGYSTLQDAMRGLRGVNVECSGGNGCNITMARAPMKCSPEYVVDERVDNIFGPHTPIRDLEGVEVYTGPSDVPGEFAGRNAGCGVIVIWTRAGPARPKP